MSRRPLAIAGITAVILLVLTTYWWRMSDDDSISNLLAPLRTSHPPPSSADAFAIRNKVASVVETRPLKTIIPIILHFASVLGPEWPILFFTRQSTLKTLAVYGQGSQPFRRMVASGQVKLVELPSWASLFHYLGISGFLASPWFWAQFGSAEHMLLFQADSILCANSGRRVEDFFEFDLVGAPHPYTREAFNGGLSLRNVTLSREIANAYDIAVDVDNGTELGLFEDVWFWDRMRDRGGNFPTRERAAEFAIDYEWAERPLGYHSPGGKQKDRLEEIYAWCPEAAMVITAEELVLNPEELEATTAYEEVETAGGRLLTFG